jgi:hypothetical protein
MLASGALASSRSNASCATGCGSFFGTLTTGKRGTKGRNFWRTAHDRAVCRNSRWTAMLDGAMPSRPRVGRFRMPVTNAERVRSVTAARRGGSHSSSNRSRVCW